MIRNPTEQQLKHLKINLKLKDGREFLGCDTTVYPFGSHDRTVSIWQGEAVLLFPMAEVAEVAMYFE